MRSPITVSTLLAFAASSYAQSSIALDPAGQGLQITQPSGSIWWVAETANSVAWTCRNTQIQTFTILVSNQNPQILAQPQAFKANVPNADCSENIMGSEFPAGPGYQIGLANINNQTDIYALSEVFEIKPKGSAFASVTTTDLGGPTSSTTGGSGSASPTSGSAQSGASSGAATKGTKVTSGLLGVAAGLFAFFA